MKRSLTVLCIVSCLLLSACNKVEAPNVTVTSPTEESNNKMTLIEEVGIESMVIKGPGHYGTSRIDVGVLESIYTIEYYSPTDRDHIDTVKNYINGHTLKQMDTSPVVEGQAVTFNISYNNGENIFLRCIERYIGKSMDELEYEWYEITEDNGLLPVDFFETIDRPLRETEEDDIQDTVVSVTRISVPITDEKIKFPSKVIECIRVSHFVGMSGGTEIEYWDTSYHTSIQQALEQIELGEPVENPKEVTGGSPYQITICFEDGTAMSISQVPNSYLRIDETYYDIGYEQKSELISKLHWNG